MLTIVPPISSAPLPYLTRPSYFVPAVSPFQETVMVAVPPVVADDVLDVVVMLPAAALPTSQLKSV